MTRRRNHTAGPDTSGFPVARPQCGPGRGGAIYNDGMRSTRDRDTRHGGAAWGRGRRLLVSLPIFLVLLGVLVAVSNLTAVEWDYEPTDRTVATLDADTAVTFDVPEGATLARRGQYEVSERAIVVPVTREATGEVQDMRVVLREPVGAGGGRPGVVFMHGAGHGTCYDSFGDVAYAMSSAGFVTAVTDKPTWSTTDVDRDYPASADAYDQVVDLLRGMEDVDPAQVGIYATSESTWISSYLLRDDPDVAFQILLSPMVYTPREALGFFVAQDFALAGAHDGYQSIVRRVFGVDAELFGLTNLDIRTLTPEAFAVPTFVAYGSKDVMTAQVDGLEQILRMARLAGNDDVTIRSYAMANHVLRLGHDDVVGEPFADRYLDDLVDWTVGTLAGLEQTSERVAGDVIVQSIAVPTELHAHRTMTVYGVVLHAAMLLLLLATAVVAAVALVRRLRRGLHPDRPTLGFRHGFGRVMLVLVTVTLLTLCMFAVGLGEVIMTVVDLAWGGAPDNDPGVMYWSWPVAQLVCTLVVWAWSCVLARLIEVASLRGILAAHPRRGAVREIVSGEQPVLATTRLGRVLFWMSAAGMVSVLLVFAFWGLFVY